MCDRCAEFSHFLVSYKEKSSSKEDGFKLKKKDVEKVVNFSQTWVQRQCSCWFRGENVERFQQLTQSIIILVLQLLKTYKGEPTVFNPKVSDDEWQIDELDKPLHFLAKVFLLNFPLYSVQKQVIQAKLEDMGQCDGIGNSFCPDMHELEVPAFLFRNVNLFNKCGGVEIMTQCFDHQSLPVTVAHAMIAVVCNLKLWINFRMVIQMFIPLRSKVLRYMCKMADKDLRTQGIKAMADYMWSAVKDPLESPASFDRDGLQLAFKYFTSSTLTMRLAGISQINNHINLYGEVCSGGDGGGSEADSIGSCLANWLLENNIISHIFGPNLHVEVIKQSHVILNFLAMECKITNEHMDIMWGAAQLKHVSKQVYDLLTPLVKHVETGPVLHLYNLLCTLEPRHHSEQSLLLTSNILKFIWASSASYSLAQGGSRRGRYPPSSTSNSDEEGSDEGGGGPTPCKRARHGTGGGKLKDSSNDSIKVEEIKDTEKKRSNADQPRGQKSKRARILHGKLKKKLRAVGEPEGQVQRGKRPVPHQPRFSISNEVEDNDDDNESDEDDDEDDEDEDGEDEEDEEEGDSGAEDLKRKNNVIANPADMVIRSGSSEFLRSSTPDSGGGAAVISELANLVQGQQRQFLRNFRPPTRSQDIVESNMSGDEEEGSLSSRMSNKSEKNMADFDGEDSACDDELAQLAATAQFCSQAHMSPQLMYHSRFLHQSSKLAKEMAPILSQFNIDSVCKPGKTLLWDLLQDENIVQLGEGLALEAEKVLNNLLCFNTEKSIRKKFIEGCLENIENNRSVVISLKLLPKLFSSFQTSPYSHHHHHHRSLSHPLPPHPLGGPGEGNVALWALTEHRMMSRFFANLQEYTRGRKQAEGGTPSVHSHVTQVQARLSFLTHIYSPIGLPENITLSIEEVDILWNCLAEDKECADEFFLWLLNQASYKDQHALSPAAIQHLYTRKMPSLSPDTITMTALNFYQQLFMENKNEREGGGGGEEGEGAEHGGDRTAMDHIWNIALRASNTDVSLAAIQYLNSYFMSRHLQMEPEFIARVMSHLSAATASDTTHQQEEANLVCIQRALLLLKSHLEIFRRRYAYHLRRWALEGQPGLGGCHTLGGPVESVRVVIHAGGYNDKICLELATSDFVADLRAEVTHWYLSLGGDKRSGDEKEHGAGSDTIRMITQGSELTMDYEEKTLGEIGFKDQQLLYISPGISRSKKRGVECPSALPPPPQHLLPTLLLLLPGHFEHLFHLMRTLSLMKTPTKEISINNHHVLHPRGQLLSRRVWDILMLLPTSPTLVRGFETLGGENSVSLEQLIDPASPQKLMYSLCIVESLSRPSSYRQKLGMAAMKASNQISDESPSVKWSDTFIAHGGLRHLFDIFMSGVLQGNSEWHQDCLAQLLKLLVQLGIQSPDDGPSPDLLDYSVPSLKSRKRKPGGTKAGGGGGDKWVIPRLTARMTDMMSVDVVLGRINSIMIQLSAPRDPNLYKTGFCVRAQVVHYVMSLLLSWSQSCPHVVHYVMSLLLSWSQSCPHVVHYVMSLLLSWSQSCPHVVHYVMSLLLSWSQSCPHVREALISSHEFPAWLHRLVLEDPEPGVRREACSALYRLVLGSPVVAPLFNLLVGFLGAAESMTPQSAQSSVHQPAEEGKEPYGPACRDYFWLMGRLVDNLPDDALREGVVDLNSLAERLTHSLATREYREIRHVPSEDDGLVGMLTLLYNILRHSPSFKSSPTGHDLLEMVFDFLFALPDPQNRHFPKCKSQSSRSAAYDLLVELVKGTMENYVTLHSRLLAQHKPGPRSPYPWDYWPTEDERSDTGYVGLTNLGATCYLASCLQHLFLMSQARRSILATRVEPGRDTKHADTLRELQKMFAYLAESERKAYNPRSFCKAYTMDHQPLNTGEQKDMAEFFIDLVSKLEEMTPELKTLVKTLFGGVLSNNVVSLDCDHVSRTLEEFYTVRCQVADMRNLYESLDEVTLKDTLEGDNMYTCSQCGRKVRAEKRACFKKLPHILCFNTMRYTFNMVTMLKEKVNTHFSFPMRLDMSGYVEKHLMPQHYQEEKLKSEARGEGEVGGEGGEDFNENYEYELIGVTVHTGTADGGHYYSFIRDRDKWLLFNDAEVKHFDSSQLAAECFGGEMTSKTYDSVNDKFMELNFEKTNSAYMLFYEWVGKEAGEQRGGGANGQRGGGAIKAEGAGSTSEMEVDPEPSSPPFSLSPELEEWIWKDNMMFLQDKNIFEHTYFQFMWQMCGYIPQTLSEDPTSMTLMTAELSTTFFLETFIHSKEKPTMVQWVELLTKQFNASQAAGEWFLKHMVASNWWPIQILIRCPNQMIRQMFQRLCFHVIQKLRESHAPLFLKSDAKEANTDLSEKDRMGYMSCLEHGAKAHLKHLTEYFSLLYDFSKMGEEESQFLIAVHAISLMVNFYLGPKSNEFVDVVSDEEEEEDIVPLPSTDKYKPASLEKMVTLVASLVEKSRGPDHALRLSNDDLTALTGGKGFPFLYQQIKECINLHQTRNLIFSLCRYNERLSNAVISMMFAAIQKHANHEACTPFFKMFTLLTEGGGSGPDSGTPCFSQAILSRIWEAAEYAPQATLDWLSVPRNKLAHAFVLQSLDTWPERFLIASNNQRVRTAAAYLLVSLVPNTHFRQGYRSARGFTSPHKEAALVPETQRILHMVLNACLKLLSTAPQYIDATPPTSSRLVQYFTVLNYFSMTRNEKLMLRNYMEDLWKLFHPKLSEPTIPINLNKQSLLIFLFHASVDCPENINALLQSPDIVKNLPFNYILADHDDHDVIMYNRAMLPAYYGLLRLCCQQSAEFRRHLASHQNIHWAFKNIAPHPSQYPAAVEELFQLMHFFAAKDRNMSEKELRDVTEFKQNTLLPFFKHLSDGRQGWLSLISAVKNLVTEDEDRKFVIMNNGLGLFFEAFQILHNMYHETSGCHITLELVELLVILLDHVKYLGTLPNKKEARGPLLGVKDLSEVIRKIATLMNTYNPPELRNLAIELLKEMSMILTAEMVKILVPLLYHCHAAFQESSDAIPMGPYFPHRGGSKASMKNAPRHPVRPIVQMAVPHNQLDGPKGEDPEYDIALLAFYTPYHAMIDTLCRLAAQQDCLSEPLITLSAILGFEAAPLHFTFFPEFWLEIAGDEELAKKYTSTLVTCPYFIDYAEAVIIDERILLNNQVIYDFLVQFFPKVVTSSSVLTEQTCQIMECLVSTLADIDSQQSDQISIASCAKLNAELRALSIVYCMQPPLLPPHQFRPLLRKFLYKVKSRQVLIGEPSRKKLTAKPKDTPQADSEEKESESKVPESATTSASVAVDSPSVPACSEKTGISSEKSGTTSEKPGISSEKSGTISDGEKPGTTSEEKKSGTTSDEGKASTTSDEGKSDKPSGVSTDKAGEDTDKTPSKSGSDKPIDDREVIVKASDTSGVDTSEVAGPSKQTDGESTGLDTRPNERSSGSAARPDSPSTIQWPAILEKTIFDLITAINTKNRPQPPLGAPSPAPNPNDESEEEETEEESDNEEEEESEEEESEEEGEEEEEENESEVGEEEEEEGEEEGK
ncbi:hypothetical protein M8J75_010579 [Diaphorina citri]|nr:hypothetical protein M8J75_010579 [Diaphorina citri]